MPEFTDLTDEAALAELGHRLARYRLDRNLTQQALAKEAGIHKNTLVRLEGGGSTQSKSLIRVLRALGLLENLDRLLPPPTPSPLRQLEYREKQRRRASSKHRDDAAVSEWSWADDDQDDQRRGDQKATGQGGDGE